MPELRASCASEVRSSNEGHEDHDDDVEPSMSTDEVEVEYEFDNNTAFVQVEFGLEDEDVEEIEGLSQIRPTLQAPKPEESLVKQSNQVWKLIFQGCIVTRAVMGSLQ